VDFSTIKFCVFRRTTISISDSPEHSQLISRNIINMSTQVSVWWSDWSYKQNISNFHKYVTSFQQYVFCIKCLLVCNSVISHTLTQKCISPTHTHKHTHTNLIALCSNFICVMNVTVSLFDCTSCSLALWKTVNEEDASLIPKNLGEKFSGGFLNFDVFWAGWAAMPPLHSMLLCLRVIVT